MKIDFISSHLVACVEERRDEMVDKSKSNLG